MDISDVRNSIIKWNLNFPYDRLWRKTYNLAFNSSGHREISFLDQVFQVEEDRLFEELQTKERYKPNTGDWLKSKESNLSFEEEIEQFNKNFEVDD